MKLSLLVTQGNAQGKSVPITIPQFVIGRDPQCHLRPASSMISKRHCAVILRDGRAYVRDFGSTNGTFLNGEPIKGEHELSNKDALKIGPLVFEVVLEMPASVDKPTPLPTQKTDVADSAGEDQAIADILLDVQEDDKIDLAAPGEEPDQGSTVLDLPAAAQLAEKPPAEEDKQPAKKLGPDNKSSTQNAAESILARYSRRNRK